MHAIARALRHSVRIARRLRPTGAATARRGVSTTAAAHAKSDAAKPSASAKAKAKARSPATPAVAAAATAVPRHVSVIEETAQRLVAAVEGTQCWDLAQPPAAPMTVDDAYAVQRLVTARLTRPQPNHPEHPKQFGWTVRQIAVGATDPVAAPLLTSQAHWWPYNNHCIENKLAHSFDTPTAPQMGVGMGMLPSLQHYNGIAARSHGVVCDFGFWFRPFAPPALPSNASQRERDAMDLAAARPHIEGVSPCVTALATRWASGAFPSQPQHVDRLIMDGGGVDTVVIGEQHLNGPAAAAERDSRGATAKDAYAPFAFANQMRRVMYGHELCRDQYGAEFLTTKGFDPVMKALDDDYADWLNEQHAVASNASNASKSASAESKTPTRRRSHVALWCNDQRVASGDGTRALRGHPLLAVAWLNRWQWTQRANGIAFASLDAHARAHGGLQFVSAGACSGTAERLTKDVDRLWVADFGAHLGAVFLDDRPVSYW